MTVLLGGLVTAYLFFADRLHVVASLSEGAVSVEEVNGFQFASVEINTKIQNLSDGPIKIVAIYFAFPDPRYPKGGCDKYVQLPAGTAFSNNGYNAPIENSGFVESGAILDHTDKYIFSAESLPQKACLYLAWRNQNGYQRIFLDEVGEYTAINSIPSGTVGGSSYRLDGGIADTVPVYPESHCLQIADHELFCPD